MDEVMKKERGREPREKKRREERVWNKWLRETMNRERKGETCKEDDKEEKEAQEPDEQRLRKTPNLEKRHRKKTDRGFCEIRRKPKQTDPKKAQQLRTRFCSTVFLPDAVSARTYVLSPSHACRPRHSRDGVRA